LKRIYKERAGMFSYKSRKLRFLVIGGLVFIGVWLALPILSGAIDASKNRLVQSSEFTPSSAALELQRKLFVADLHSDTLLWKRNFWKKNRIGHMDFPRLLEGNVGLQVFSMVTQVPRGLNYFSNGADSDVILPLFMLQKRPVATWKGPKNRALEMASELESWVQESGGGLKRVRSQADLLALLEERKQGKRTIGTILSIEGAHALEGQLSALAEFDRLGVRMIGLGHFFDNEVGGSAHGLKKGGLTPFGRELIPEMEKRGILVDLAHSSADVIRDVLELAKRPVVVSHTGIGGICPSPRNLTDEQLRKIAQNGGLIGVGFWESATCELSLKKIIDSIEYVKNLVGIRFVALGSDFDGSVTMPLDVSGLARLTEGLLQRGFSTEDIEWVMGGNARRLFLESLPPH
jgi:microsomal dipeptidase-like Zn-dependent dipeptidase